MEERARFGGPTSRSKAHHRDARNVNHHLDAVGNGLAILTLQHPHELDGLRAQTAQTLLPETIRGVDGLVRLTNP